MQALEALVVKMESGELTLNQSLDAFEKGVALGKRCQTALNAAEQRVKVLLEKSVSATPQPFNDAPQEATPTSAAATLGAADNTSTSNSTMFDDNIPF